MSDDELYDHIESDGQSLTYAVDIVMCIDITGSMTPVLDTVKAGALKFNAELERKLAEKDKRVEQLRVRVIAFRDFAADDDVIVASEFFVLPDKSPDFEAFVKRLSPGGGGDAPESSLDALAMAMKSDWVTGLDKRRHVIVMFTDAPSHPLAHAAHHRQYPKGIASSMTELYDQWEGDGQTGGMEHSAKRLLLFAPDGDPWTELANDLTFAIFHPSRAGEGVADHDYDEILELIAGSV